MSLLDTVHGQHVAKRRAQVLSQHLAKFVPAHKSVLDVGSGDGEIAWLLGQLRPDLQISGVDVLVRPDTMIPVRKFDGKHLPFADKSQEVVMLVDVLHHCDDPAGILREASRVARKSVVIKDHLRDGVAAEVTLRFMDWVGNHRYGVALPYNYLSWSEWQQMFDELDLKIGDITKQLDLYTWPAGLLFDRSLHFIARLIPQSTDFEIEQPEEMELVHAGV